MPGVVEPEPAPEVDVNALPPAAELPVDNTPPRSYVVFKQSVDLEIDFREKAVFGTSNLTIALTGDVSEVFIDARQCDIDVKKIRVSNCEVEASYKDPCDWIKTPDNYRWSAAHWGLRKSRMTPLLHHKRTEVSALDHDIKCCTPIHGNVRVQLPSGKDIRIKNKDANKSDPTDHSINPDDSISMCTVSVPFRLRNSADGLHFVGVEEADTRYPHVYTRHSSEPGTACSIFPCIDDPGSRNSWKISITCPRTVGDAFHQALATQQHFRNSTVANRNRKRKHGEDGPARSHYPLTEEDKLLEMTVVCSGYLTNETITEDETKRTMTFEIDKNKAAKHVGFAVGPFEHVDLWSEFRTEEDDVKLGVSAAKVHGYCLPGRAEEVRNTCAAIVTAVDYFVLTFGRYPFESYKVCFVDDMVEDTVSLCAFSLCSSKLLYPREVIDFEVDTIRILVHALASQWFGVNVVPNQKSDIWLIVGIAWFMTDQFIKFLCGTNEFRFRMKERADRLVQIDIGRPSLQDLGEHLYLGDFEVEFMNLKAPLVLFILDRRLSKSSSSAGLTRIISKMVGKANTTVQASDEVLMSEHFRKACEKTGGSRLDSFWSQWITGSGCPRFDVYQRFNKKRLCVEMTIRQVQDIAAAKKRHLLKDDFWREVREEKNEVYAAELHHCFTGPMTIRIHEADGTPYEHIVDIREDQAKSAKFEIPYNTKYKRLKRNRRQRERQMAGSARGNEDGQEEMQQVHFLGDVLQHPDEMDEWNLRDWDEETEAKMDQESYEWIRMDADFEWVCDMKTNLPPYMYVSQLQQDRDVVAQQDSMLYLDRSFPQVGPHPLVSTILTRTIVDKTYFHGIRTMAVDVLPRHAVKSLNWIGLVHLQKTFQHFFCRPGTFTPRPNNFSDKRQYFVQRAIPEAVARVRGDDGHCPREARRFILEQLQANNNSDNVYSDQLYICRLIKALAICQIPDEKKAKQNMSMSMTFGDADDEEEPMDTEPQEFRELARDEIERYRRMDEYSPSYQNCFTVAALEALCLLMKAKVIPANPIVFVQYLQDGTADLVRIKACEALVELGTLKSPSFLRFFLSLLSTDSSPFVRDRLFKVLCRGLAGVAFGEHVVEDKTPQQPAEDGLIVEQESTDLEAVQKKKARREDLTSALAALKDEFRDDEELPEAIWNALDSPVLTVAERINLLELCSILIDEDYSFPITFKYPTYWTVTRGERSRNKCVVNFKRHFRTRSRKKYDAPAPPPPPKPEPKRTITLNLNRAPSLSSGKPPTPTVSEPAAQLVTAPPKAPLPSAAAKPAPVAPKPSAPKASVSAAKPRIPTPTTIKAGSPSTTGSQRDSISVQTPLRPTVELPQTESKATALKTNGNSTPSLPKIPKPPKRASTESESGRPTKIVKLNTSKIPVSALERLQKSKPRKLVKLKFNGWDKLRRRPSPPVSGSIRATPKSLTEQKPNNGPRIPGSPSSPAAAITKTNAVPSSSPTLAASQASSTLSSASKTSQTPSQPLSQPSKDGKPRKPLPDPSRKPLPDTRKPLPSAPHHPPPSASHSQPKDASSTSAPKAPTKLKIKIKPSSQQ
ncbi:hypothetical protein DL769_005177 [Monosporascus sp. CRB-8-3]|nr:hypothetical protein DL769_005177 [Monosporascus sp. CRB-8-3]